MDLRVNLSEKASTQIQKELLFLLTYLFILFIKYIKDHAVLWTVFLNTHGKIMYVQHI